MFTEFVTRTGAWAASGIFAIVTAFVSAAGIGKFFGDSATRVKNVLQTIKEIRFFSCDSTVCDRITFLFYAPIKLFAKNCEQFLIFSCLPKFIKCGKL
jgi:hypothetical protein